MALVCSGPPGGPSAGLRIPKWWLGLTNTTHLRINFALEVEVLKFGLKLMIVLPCCVGVSSPRRDLMCNCSFSLCIGQVSSPVLSLATPTVREGHCRGFLSYHGIVLAGRHETHCEFRMALRALVCMLSFRHLLTPDGGSKIWLVAFAVCLLSIRPTCKTATWASPNLWSHIGVRIYSGRRNTSCGPYDYQVIANQITIKK